MTDAPRSEVIDNIADGLEAIAMATGSLIGLLAKTGTPAQTQRMVELAGKLPEIWDEEGANPTARRLVATMCDTLIAAMTDEGAQQ